MLDVVLPPTFTFLLVWLRGLNEWAGNGYAGHSDNRRQKLTGVKKFGDVCCRRFSDNLIIHRTTHLLATHRRHHHGYRIQYCGDGIQWEEIPMTCQECAT
jgi:hypothetical protein